MYTFSPEQSGEETFSLASRLRGKDKGRHLIFFTYLSMLRYY